MNRLSQKKVNEPHATLVYQPKRGSHDRATLELCLVCIEIIRLSMYILNEFQDTN